MYKLLYYQWTTTELQKQVEFISLSYIHVCALLPVELQSESNLKI